MSRTTAVLTILIFGGAQIAPAAPPAAERARRGKESAALPATSEAVALALENELAGNNAERLSLLRQRTASSPADASARWHLGEVNVEGTWIPWSQVVDRGDRRQELHRYRAERSQRNVEVEDQLWLANDAKSRNLRDEERAHLTQVVTLDPAHQQAHSRLSDIQVDGQWVSRESALRSLRAQSRWQESAERYGFEAARFTKRLRKGPARTPGMLLDAFQAWEDPERLFALEPAVGDPGDAVHEAYILWLGGFDCCEASIALARQAVFSDHAAIRVLASKTLKSRPVEDYLRELIASVKVVSVHPEIREDKRLGLHAASLEWKDLDEVGTTRLVLRHPSDVVRTFSVWFHFDVTESRGDTAKYHALNAHLMRMYKREAEERAVTAAFRNERVFRTLSTVMDRSIQSADEAWKLWHDVADTEPGQSRVSLNYDQSWYFDGRAPRRTKVQQGFYRQYQMTCLAAGTPIQTETGPQPIETIEPGDRVLSQDIETGELSLKPVFARTRRERAKQIRLKTEDNDVVCSQGHPFWVNGIGWVQARALQPRMPLHTVLGSTEVTAVEPAGEGEVYNLVVADAHTYFIGGENAFLSHDITHRQATNALVPGLQPIWVMPNPNEADEKPLTAR